MHGSTVVLVGDLEVSDSSADRNTDAAVLTSTDGGLTWQSVAVPSAVNDSGWITTLSDVAWAGNGFVATDSTYQIDDSYGRVLFASPDGATWQPQDTPPTGGGVTATDPVGLDTGLVVGLEVQESSGSRDELFHRGPEGWAPVATPPGDPDVRVLDTVRTGSALLAITADEGQPTNYSLWRSTDGGAGFVAVPLTPVPSAGARIATADLAVAPDGSLLVAGSDQGKDVVWTQTDEQAWAPTRIPAALTTGHAQVETGPGGLLVWNRREAFGNEFAVLWTGPDPAQLERVNPAGMAPVGRYQMTAINDAAWIGDRWYVVGEQWTNGTVRRSALILTSPDGRDWSAGAAAQVFSRGDDYTDYDSLTDLTGLDGTGRSMAAVVGVQGAPVIVGEVFDGEDRKAAMWRSDDRTTWTLTELPMDGLQDVAIMDAAAVGSTVVVHGFGAAPGSTDYLDRFWVSPDAGATWQLVSAGSGKQPDASVLTATPTGFVLVSTPENGPTVQAWTSKDGQAWSTLALDLPAMGPDTTYELNDVVAAGDDVAVLVTVRAPHATRSVVLRQAVA